MDCYRCKSGNSEGQKYCGKCGAPLDFSELLRQEVGTSLKDLLRDQKVVESELAETVANRLLGWGKIVAALIAIPLGILSIALSINLHDLSKTAEQGRTDVETKIHDANDRAAKVGNDALALQKRLDEAGPKLDRLDAIQVQLNDKLSVLQKGVDSQLASLNSKVDQVQSQIVCVDTLKSCPMSGCADSSSPQGIQNALKKTIPRGVVKPITFANLKTLQDQADQLVGERKPLAKTERERLKNLSTVGGTFSEGDAVRLVGYLVGHPRVEGRESVNCSLTGVENADFHLNIAPHKDDTEFASIVAEMIPQDRLPGWNYGKLQKLLSKQVMVTGQLFYDNSHKTNSDPQGPPPDPRRFSLWEVHPVTTFMVCSRDACDPNQQAECVPLEKVP
jgi:hypothetical protein